LETLFGEVWKLELAAESAGEGNCDMVAALAAELSVLYLETKQFRHRNDILLTFEPYVGVGALFRIIFA
jgi:hypothetical protein